MICPLMSKPNHTDNMQQGLILCRKSECAWWCDNICAVVQIAKQIARVAKANEVSK